MKAKAFCVGKSADYTSLCAPFESNADHVLIEAWRKLDKPSDQIKVKLGTSEIIGKVRVSSIGVPYASESRWIRTRPWTTRTSKGS